MLWNSESRQGIFQGFGLTSQNRPLPIGACRFSGTSCPEKRDQQCFVHNFVLIKCIVAIFGTFAY